MAKICPRCRTDFSTWITRCPDCGAVLVADDDPLLTELEPDDDEPDDDEPDDDEPGDDEPDDDEVEPEQIVYELGGYPLSVQARIAEALAHAGIAHAWQGTDLIIGPDEEAEVDEIFAEFEGEEPADAAESAGLSETTYDVTEWSADDRAELAVRLNDAGIPHRLDSAGAELSLVVALRDEPLVEAIMDELDGAGASASADPELLGDLFVAAARLGSDANQADGLATLARLADEVDPASPPFGVPRSAWQNIVDAVDDLADVVADEAGLPDEIMIAAKRLRELLRPFV